MDHKQFIAKLQTLTDQGQRGKYLTTLQLNDKNKKLGVPMGKIFALAKANADMPNEEIAALVKSDIHEAKVGGVSIMDFQARNKKTPEAQRKWLYDTYLKLHQYINSWDLVDRSGQHVIGGYLYDFKKPRDILYKLAKSKDWCERRTAIVATLFFIRQGDVDDTFKVAELLVGDNEDLVQKAVGGVLREAGKKDTRKLTDFLDKYASKMPRDMLTYATEKLSAEQKAHYKSSR
ncbi:MAG: DNA alkylation repair protein [Candidatus Saccharimonadales bacterium]